MLSLERGGPSHMSAYRLQKSLEVGNFGIGSAKGFRGGARGEGLLGRGAGGMLWGMRGKVPRAV